jgi:membrane protein YdbS with pleckstrin-like domain
MTYIERSLGNSEAILYRARFPWFYYAFAWLALAAFVVAGIAAYAYAYPLLSALLIVAGLALFIALLEPLWTTEIGVTNQRFIYKRGLLWRTTQELQLRAIEEVNLEQGVLGRLFDFGRLQLHGTGVNDIRLPNLADPVGLRKALQDGIAAAAAPVGMVAPTAVAPAPASSTA